MVHGHFVFSEQIITFYLLSPAGAVSQQPGAGLGRGRGQDPGGRVPRDGGDRPAQQLGPARPRHLRGAEQGRAAAGQSKSRLHCERGRIDRQLKLRQGGLQHCHPPLL